MTDAPASDEYDKVTSDDETIRSRIEEWDGAPALTDAQPDGTEPTIVFEEPTEDAERVPWDEFFEHLDSESVALAYRTDDDGAATPPAYEFVQRPDREQDGRADASSEKADTDHEEPSDGLQTDTGEQVADRRSQVREREAEKQENPDNHRDREPFQG